MLEYSWPGSACAGATSWKRPAFSAWTEPSRLDDMQFETFDLEKPVTEAGLSLENSERRVLVSALERADWVIKDAAADLLGIQPPHHHTIKSKNST